MNKSWKSFDMLTSDPVCTRKEVRGYFSGGKAVGSLRRNAGHIKRLNSRKALFDSHEVLEVCLHCR